MRILSRPEVPSLQCGDIARVFDNVNRFNSHRSFAHRSSETAAPDTTANQVSFREDRVNAGRQITSEETERNSVLPFKEKAVCLSGTLTRVLIAKSDKVWRGKVAVHKHLNFKQLEL